MNEAVKAECVYIVISGKYSDSIDCVFSTKEQADQYVKTHNTGSYYIKEFELNKWRIERENVVSITLAALSEKTSQGEAGPSIIRPPNEGEYRGIVASKRSVCIIAPGDEEEEYHEPVTTAQKVMMLVFLAWGISVLVLFVWSLGCRTGWFTSACQYV